MLTDIHYVVRSRKDGKYLVARLHNPATEQENQHLLVFSENYDALSYLNTHAGGLAAEFSVESLSGGQLKAVLKRWGFQGIGVVNEPLEPRIKFLLYS
jgi:hypothetical protein